MNIAIILSGCGNCDGSELQETLSLMLAFDRRDWHYQCFAPQGPYTVYDHRSGKPNGQQRDILEESSRIARGNILPLADLDISNYDALAIPGGMGAARNLSTFDSDKAGMTVRADVQAAILSAYTAGKIIMAECIAPMILAKVLGPYNVVLTLGQPCTASQIAEQLGARHQCCKPTEYCVDSQHRIFTTPAYMVSSRISEIFEGTENMVSAVEKAL